MAVKKATKQPHVMKINCIEKSSESNIRKTRVAAYARVSTALDSQKSSMKNQVEVYTKKITENPDWEFAGIYAESEISGTRDDRPEFQRMIRDAERHKFDMVLVKSLSRFARNTLIAIQVIRRMKECGVRMVFEKEGLDTAEPGSEMMLTIMSAFAQEESRNISERIKKGLHMRALNGEVNWAPLYGYKKVGDTPYVIEESEAEVVRRIFRDYEKGYTIRDIAEMLNADEIPSPAGGTWSGNKVFRLIDNERYVGDVITHKTYTVDHISHKSKKNNGEAEQVYLENHHEPIIDRKQHERVQQIKKMRKDHTYPFYGLLRCPHCRGLLEYEPSALGTRKAAWKCDNDHFYIPADKIEDLVLMAYARLDASDVEDERTKEIKAEYPRFEQTDFWWMDELMDSITFGEHEGKDDKTMTVNWLCGKKTMVHTRFPEMRKIRYKKLLREKKLEEAAEVGEKKVNRIPRTATAENRMNAEGIEAEVKTADGKSIETSTDNSLVDEMEGTTTLVEVNNRAAV